MKLLLDQNVSPALVRRLADLYPDSAHVFTLGMGEADDISICEFAVEQGFVVVTKDADYCELLSLRQTPPKIIWIRTGNCSSSEVENLLRFHAEQIKAFGSSESVVLLMLF
jgi:predicted nuclease of predicted toxin-antitoxin system